MLQRNILNYFASNNNESEIPNVINLNNSVD